MRQNAEELRILFSIIRYELRENLRNLRLLVYSGALFLFSAGLFYFSGTSPNSAGSLINLILLIVPLFSFLFGALSVYDSIPFFHILLSRGISRRSVYFGKWTGLAVALSIGASAALLSSMFFVPQAWRTVLFLAVLTVFLQNVCLAFSFFLGLLFKRRDILLGIALLSWFFLYILYDIFIILVASYSNEYPLEIPTLVLLALNPLDLVRVMFLVEQNLSELLGYSSAVAIEYFGKIGSLSFSLVLLAVWQILAILGGLKLFDNKDL